MRANKMLILINLLKAYWKPLCAVLLVLAVYWHEHSLYSDIARLNGIIEQSKVVAQVQIEKNKQTVAEQKKITADVVNSYADSINKVNEYYAKNPTTKFKPFGVCLSPASSGGVRTETDSTKGTDTEANGANQATTARDSAEVQIDMDKLSKEIVQLLELREFELKQDSIK